MSVMNALLIAALMLGTFGQAPAASPSPAPSATPAPVVIHMADFMFSQDTVTIPAGATVQWVNDDEVQHSASADDGSWGSGELSKGQTWSHTFATPGVYTYHCDDHTYMKAEIDVK